MKIEAQGKEAIIRNSNGDVAIIPIQHVREVMDMIKDGCHGCIDKYVSGLPKASNYAEDGTIIPDDPVINLNNPNISAKKGMLIPDNPPYTPVADKTNIQMPNVGVIENKLEGIKYSGGTLPVTEITATKDTPKYRDDTQSRYEDVLTIPYEEVHKMPIETQKEWMRAMTALRPHYETIKEFSNIASSGGMAPIGILEPAIGALAGVIGKQVAKYGAKYYDDIVNTLNKFDLLENINNSNNLMAIAKPIPKTKAELLKISDDDYAKLEKYLIDNYDYDKLPKPKKREILEAELKSIKKENISIDERIDNNNKMLQIWDNYKNERKEYFNSPKFKERVNKQYGKMPDHIFEEFKNSLLGSLENRPYIIPDVISNYSDAHYKINNGIGFNKKRHYPGHSYFKDGSAIDKNTVMHEARHQLTNGDDEKYFFPNRDEIRKNLKSPMLSKDDLGITGYHGYKEEYYYTSPHEFITRLDELKRNLSIVGYDYKTMDLTPEILKKYKNLQNNGTGYITALEIVEKKHNINYKDFNIDHYNEVEELIGENIKTEDSKNLLRWFNEDFLIDQINNKWGIIPPASLSTYIQSTQNNQQ